MCGASPGRASSWWRRVRGSPMIWPASAGTFVFSFLAVFLMVNGVLYSTAGTRRAAKLPATELRAPERVIGRRTEECIQAGVLFGTADAVDGIVRRITAEWPGGKKPRVVATGGLAAIVAPLTTTIELTDPDLTLRGLRIAARHLGLEW